MREESLRTGHVVGGQVEPIEPGSLFTHLSIVHMGKDLYQTGQELNFTEEQLEYVALHVSLILAKCDILTKRYIETSQN